MKKKKKKSLSIFWLIPMGVLILIMIFGYWKKSKNLINYYYYYHVQYQKPQFASVKLSTKSINTIHLPILVYHYVEYVKDKGDTIRQGLNIPPYLFEDQLKTLNEDGYTSYFADDVPDIFSGKIDSNAKNIILTFDDGYDDFYYYAYPLLKKYKIKATIYIIYDFIGYRGFLNEKQIKEMIDSGLVKIGSHTLDHFYLKTATSKEAIKQIVESKTMFEKKFGVKVNTFAYPYGVFTPEDMRLVKEAGYTAAVSMIKDLNQTDNEIFFLSRLRASGFDGKSLVKYIEN